MSLSVDPRIGSELFGYRVEALLGRGGMSVVYRAHDLALDRKVALKLLAPELAEDERFRSRFLRESRVAASLDHPNVVPIYEAGEADGLLCIAMRYVEGTDLKRLLRAEGALDPDAALALLRAGRLRARRRPRSTASSTATSSRRTSSSPGAVTATWPTSGSPTTPPIGAT